MKSGKWKGVRRNLKKGDDAMMLFDLDADPGETTDVAQMHPEVVLRISGMMAEAHEPSEVFPLPMID